MTDKIGISSLPDELLVNIIWRIYHNDFPSFVLTQRKLHRVSNERLLDHQRKLKSLKHVVLHDGVEPASKTGTAHYSQPVDFLSLLWQDPSVASYPHTLLVTSLNHLRWDQTAGHRLVDEKAQEVARRCDYFHSLIEGSSLLASDDMLNTWFTKGAKQGEIDIYLQLILMQTTNLRYLILEQYVEAQSLLEHARSTNVDVLPNLQRVYWDSRDVALGEEYGELTNLTQWALLPGLRELAGQRLVHDGDYLLWDHMPGRPFDSLESLRLIECDLDGVSLEDMLDGLSGLKSFCYEHAMENSGTWRWDTTLVIWGLEQCALDTLEELTLHITTPPMDTIESLKQFKRLRRFEGTFELLARRDVKANGHRIYLDLDAVFPAESITELSFDMTSISATIGHWDYFLDNIPCCTRLKQIEFSPGVVTPPLRQVLTENGVNIKISPPSYPSGQDENRWRWGDVGFEQYV